MTIETRTTVELDDIKAYEFECSKCHSKIVKPLSAAIDIPTRCDCEDKQWIIPGSPGYRALVQFIEFLRQPTINGEEGFTFRLEIAALGERK